MEKRFARAHGYDVGDRVDVVHDRGRLSLRVVGLVSSAEFIWISQSQRDPRPVARRVGVLFTSDRDASTLAGYDGIHEIHVRVKEGYDNATIMTEARRRVQPYAPGAAVPRADQISHSLLEHDRRALAGVALVFPLVFLVVGAVIQASASKQLVTRQRRQIGVFLALGLSPAQVATPYRAISLLLGGGGGLLGTLAGHGLGRMCTWYYASTLGLPFVVTSPHVPLLVIGTLWAALVSVGATEHVVRRFVRTEPGRLCHPDFAPTLWLPRFETRFPRWARASLMVRLPVRNLFRNPARSLLALAGLTLAVVQVLMTLALFDSLGASVDFFFEKVHKYDVYVSLRHTSSPSFLPPVERWPGVLRVEQCLYQAVLVTTRGRTVDVGVLGVPAGSRLLQIHDSERRPLDVSDTGPLFMSAVLQRRLDARPDDPAQVRIDVPAPLHPVLHTVIGPTLFEPVAINPRLPLRRLQELASSTWRAPPNGINVLLLKVAPGAMESVRRRLDHCREVETVVDLPQAQEDVRSLLRVVNAFLTVMLVFSGLLAFTLLSGTTTMSILERTRELAIMSSLGLGDRQVARLLVTETSLLVLVALATGIPAGWMMGTWLLNHYQSDVIQATLTLSVRSVLGTTLACLAISVAATLHGLRFTRRSPVEATEHGE